MLGDEFMDPSSSSHPPRPSCSDVTDGAQAHYNARTHSDEYVVDLLVSLDRVKVLVHDLLAIEVRVGDQYGDVTVWNLEIAASLCCCSTTSDEHLEGGVHETSRCNTNDDGFQRG